MKKLSFILAMLILLTASIMVTSCGEESSTPTDTADASEILSAIMANFPDAPTGITCTTNDSEEDKEQFELITGPNNFGDGIEFPELAVIESYAVFLPETKSSFRVAVFKSKSDSDVAKIENACKTALDMIKNSDIGQYDDSKGTMRTMADNGYIYTAGKYVILLITSDNKAAEKSAQDIIYK